MLHPPPQMDPSMHQQQVLQAPGTEGEPLEGDETNEDQNLRPTSLQQKMLAMAGQDIDHFMREVCKTLSLILVIHSFVS